MKLITKSPFNAYEFVEVQKGKTLDFLQKQVGGLVDCIRLKNKIDMWVNDEFLFIDEAPNVVLVDENDMITQVIKGTVVFATYDDEGNTCELTKDQIIYLLHDDDVSFRHIKDTEGNVMQVICIKN